MIQTIFDIVAAAAFVWCLAVAFCCAVDGACRVACWCWRAAARLLA